MKELVQALNTFLTNKWLKYYNSSIAEFNEQEFIDFILTDFLKVKRTLNEGEKVINVIPYNA